MKRIAFLFLLMAAMGRAVTWYAQAGSRNITAWSGDSSTVWFDAPSGGTAMGGVADDTWANTVGTARGLQTGDVLCANAQTALAIDSSITCLRISTVAEVDGGDTGTAGGGFTVVADYINASAKALDDSTPKTGGAGIVQFRRAFVAGEATNATINRVAIVDNTTNAGEADATHTFAISVFAATINKAASDTLTVTWNVTFLGA